MMQVKPYKPMKLDNMTKASELEKPRRTLDDYAKVAGIQPQKNPLEPYAKLWREQQAGGTATGAATPKPANYVYNSKPQSVAQMAAQSAEGGIPEAMPGAGLAKPNNTTFGTGLAGNTKVGADGFVGQKKTIGSMQDNRLARSDDPWIKYAKVAGVPYTPSKSGQFVQPGTGAAEQLKSEQLRETPFTPEETPVETPRYDEYSSWRKTFDDQYGGDFASYDPSGLDAYDRELYDLNKANYDMGLAEEERVRAALRETERQRNIQLQQAFINSELTKKYLPEYLKQIGMNGLGATQSMLAQKQNDYQQNRNDIISSVDQNRRITLDDYAAVMRENAYKNQQDILTKKKEHEGEVKTKQAEAYERASNLLMSADTTEKIDKLLADYKGLIDEDQYQVLEAQADSLRNDPDFELNEEYRKNYEALGNITRTTIECNKGFGERKGDNFSIIDSDGFKYRIESGGEKTDAALIQKSANISDNGVFGLNGKIYIKMDGKIYLIQQRAKSYHDHYEKLYKKIFG